MANKKVVGELVYEIRGDDNQYNKVINNADKKAKELGSSFDKTNKGMQSGLDTTVKGIRNLAVTYLGFNVLKNAFFSVIDASKEMENSLIGLDTVTRAFGQNIDATREGALALADDGLLTLTEASEGLKNLIATGFELPQAIKLMEGFKDSASFNRQGTLEFGQAIVGATQGIKNQNSIMVDNAGITKNLSNILKEAGMSANDLGSVTSDVSVRTALYNGLLKEMSIFQGDSSKASNTLAGQQAKLRTQVFNLKAAIGDALVPIVLKAIQGFLAFTESIGGPAGVAKGARIAVDSFKLLFQSLKILATGFGAIVTTIYDFAVLLKDVWKKPKQAFDNFKTNFNGTTDTIQTQWDSLTDTISNFGKETELDKTKLSLEDVFKAIKGGSDSAGAGIGKATDKIDEMKKAIEQIEDQSIELEDKGTKAIQELAENNVKDLEKIEDKISSLQTKLLELQQSLAEDLAKQDVGIAEKIVAEERKIAELRDKLKEEQGKEKPDATEIQSLTAEIAQRERILKENAELTKKLDEEINEARRRASLSDIERSIEDYIAKKEQIQLEYEEKKLALENELLLEEENKAKTLALLQDKQEQINTIIELGNQRFQDLADNRVKITEEEVKKQISWYNKLAEAIAKSKSATRTSELPQFHKGGYVTSGGEVHAGEYVIPANMVNKYSGLIKALEGARIGSAGSTTNNNVNMNNVINEQIDMDAVLKNMSFELNK